MITAQDIRGKTFEKAVFGGYDMTAVDGFMSEVANDLMLLQKENAVLKGKMKVLVDKIEEYRANEDALHRAVLSAQKMGSAIEQEAREKAEAILAAARREASEVIGGADAAAEAEKLRLEETRRSSAKFIDSMEALCRKQLDFLQRVGELDFVKQLRASRPAPAEAAPAAPAQTAQAAQVQTARAAQAAPAQAVQVAQAVQAARAVQAAPAQAAQAAHARPAEIHETVKSIEETVARVMEEPLVDVRPELQPAVAAVDERPTRPFNVVSDEEEDVSRAVLFPGGQ